MLVDEVQPFNVVAKPAIPELTAAQHDTVRALFKGLAHSFGTGETETKFGNVQNVRSVISNKSAFFDTGFVKATVTKENPDMRSELLFGQMFQHETPLFTLPQIVIKPGRLKAYENDSGLSIEIVKFSTNEEGFCI
jgi:hypothetical protein